MERNDKHLKAQLIALKRIIKQKYKAFKEGTEASDLLLEKQYKPIISELRKTTPGSIDIKAEQSTVKEEPMDYEALDFNLTDEEEEEESSTTFTPASTPKARELSDFVSTPLQEESTTQYIKLHFKNPTTRRYMTLLFKDAGRNDKAVDYVFGPHFVNGDKLMVGNEDLEFDRNGNILIGEVNYGSSEGLYELLFKKDPDSKIYTEKDLDVYKSILLSTNAHRNENKPDGRIKSYRTSKYKKIIKNLFPAQGKGMHWKTITNRDVIYWDDPNELVGRLQHISMSTESGHRGHTNEILNIVEELREANFIKGSGNSRFKALLK